VKLEVIVLTTIKSTGVLFVSLFVSLFVTLSPSYTVLPGNIDYFDNQRMMELLISCVILLCTSLQKNSTVFNQKPVFTSSFSLIFLLFACISAFLSPSSRHAFLEISSFYGLLYLSVFLENLLKEHHFALTKTLTYSILVGAVIYTIGFLAGYLASFVEHIPLRWPEPFHGFSNLRFFNQYQLWTLGLMSLPILSFKLDNNRFRVLIFATISSWWMMLFASAGRGVLLALCVAAIATFFVYRDFARPFLRLQGLALLTGLSVHILLFRIAPLFLVDPLYSGSTLAGSVLRYTTEDRLTLWRQALAMIKEHPFFGVGPMHFAWYPNLIAAHPHNSILQLAAEWGLPATFLVVGFSTYGIYSWLKVFNKVTLKDTPQTERHLPIILFFTLTTCALYSLVDGVIVMPMSQVMMAVVVGIMLGVYSETTTQQSAEIKIVAFLPYRIFAGVVLVTLIWSAWPGLIPRLTGDTQKIRVNLEVEGPRFWHDGGIPH
jgi:putative inorganic carbon (hco3(-)) transporter